MQSILSILESTTFHWVAGDCLGSMITVLLTVWCQRELIKEQFKLQKDLAENEHEFQQNLMNKEKSHDFELARKQQINEMNLESQRQSAERRRDFMNRARQ